jgi:hypothetical protein
MRTLGSHFGLNFWPWFRMPLQVMDVPKYSHITPIQYVLHWLPVHARIQFKVLLFAFKTIHDLAPSYIKDLINVKSKSSFNLRSNNGTLLEPPADRMLTTLGARSFHAAAPRHLWNSLPLGIRSLTSIDLFKKSIKTHLFRNVFTDFL